MQCAVKRRKSNCHAAFMGSGLYEPAPFYFTFREIWNMPKTKFQGIIFGLIMSYSMAIGMEIYNVAIKMGYNVTAGGFSNMTGRVFPAALAEASFMGLIVFIVSNLVGNRVGSAFAAKYTDPEKDNPYFCRVMRQVGTVAVMCPAMSLVATVLFSVLPGNVGAGSTITVWIGTVMKNFPMAFFWNMFAAAPFTRLVFGEIFSGKPAATAQAARSKTD